MREPWRITLLGELKAEREQLIVSRFRSRKTAGLLAYLALNLHRPHPREELVERFWPTADTEDGRGSLRTALASLRRQLEPPGTPAGAVLASETLTVRLNPETVRVDVVEARGVLKRNRGDEILETAHITAPHELLPGFYEDWVQDARVAWAHDLRQLLRLAREAAVRAGRIQDALALARRLADLEPLDEDANFGLVRVLSRTGQNGLATAHYQAFAETLERELRRKPSLGLESFTDEQVQLPEIEVPTGSAPRPEIRSLPLTFTRFLGREAELAWVVGATGRLVTITGPGGAGKTRLAVEAARRVPADRTWFVPLAETRDASQIPGAILEALQIQRALESTLDLVVEHLRSQPGSVLLVLDNFEQIAEEGSKVVKALLERVPNLTCLVTSRQRLELEGEQELALTPLPVPDRSGTPERLLEFPSVQLFVDRAKLARADFQITSRNAGAVAALCERLEGIPLALELAASRASVLSPEQMLSQLQARLDFLVSKRRDVAPRHRSLRAAISWSYESLDSDLQSYFKRLSVLRGTWTLEAAEAVAGDDIPPLDALSELLSRSLVMSLDTPDGMRYRMLDVIREFAWEQLDAGEKDELEARHFGHFLSVVEGIEPRMSGSQQAVAFQELESWQDNLRAALASAESSSAARMAGALWRFWLGRGHWREGREILDRALGAHRTEDLLRLRALQGAGTLSTQLGDYPAARNRHEESLTLARTLHDRRAEADALHDLAVLAIAGNEIERGRTLHESALAIRRELNDQAGVAQSLNNLGNLAYDQNQTEDAKRFYEEGLKIRRRLGEKRGIAASLNNLGNLASDQGDYVSATTYLQESFEFWRALGDPWGISLALGNLAEVARLENDFPRAHSLNAQCLTARWELGDRKLVAGSFESFGHLLADEGRWTEAATMLAAAQAVREAIGLFIRPSERETYERNMARVRAALGFQGFQSAWEQGISMSAEEALEAALRCAKGGNARPESGANARPPRSPG